MIGKGPKILRDTFVGDLVNALLLRPPYRKPKEPEKPQERFYGGDGTIHQTGHVDVVVDKSGKVVAVWYRCAMLPFKQSTVFYGTGEDLLAASEQASPIKGITFEDSHE